MRSFLRRTRQSFQRNLFNAPGFRTSRRLVVIESDDWGAVRMPSSKVYKDLLESGVINGDDPFTRYDSLASNDDLEHLFLTLDSFRDRNGNAPVITANCVLCNPDFEKIKEDQFRNYHCQPFYETLASYPRHDRSLKLWKEGLQANLFIPQYHGREHVNFHDWLVKLRNNDKSFIKAFDHNTYAIDSNIVASLGYSDTYQLEGIRRSIIEGYNLFIRVFGYAPGSFIAPNNTWDLEIEKSLAGLDIKYIQGSRLQNIRTDGGPVRSRYHYFGQKNSLGQYYLVRNCLFEPSLSEKVDYVSLCLRQISNSFFWHKPAIISSHRLNYIGTLDEKNRIRSLSLLRELLKQILKNWPDAEFVNSYDIGKLVETNER